MRKTLAREDTISVEPHKRWLQSQAIRANTEKVLGKAIEINDVTN